MDFCVDGAIKRSDTCETIQTFSAKQRSIWNSDYPAPRFPLVVSKRVAGDFIGWPALLGSPREPRPGSQAPGRGKSFSS